jgi:hypothetical protein
MSAIFSVDYVDLAGYSSERFGAKFEADEESNLQVHALKLKGSSSALRRSVRDG